METNFNPNYDNARRRRAPFADYAKDKTGVAALGKVIVQPDGSKIRFVGTTTIPAKRVAAVFESVREKAKKAP
jgi:hypothetical protein